MVAAAGPAAAGPPRSSRARPRRASGSRSGAKTHRRPGPSAPEEARRSRPASALTVLLALAGAAAVVTGVAHWGHLRCGSGVGEPACVTPPEQLTATTRLAATADGSSTGGRFRLASTRASSWTPRSRRQFRARRQPGRRRPVLRRPRGGRRQVLHRRPPGRRLVRCGGGRLRRLPGRHRHRGDVECRCRRRPDPLRADHGRPVRGLDDTQVAPGGVWFDATVWD